LQHIPIHKRLLSLIYPVKIRSGAGGQFPVPELFLYQGRFQLATQDALYSDGKHYRPMLTAYKKLKHHLPAVENVLVMGCGLASAVEIMYGKGYKPRYTLVDIDKEVMRWALELLPDDAAAKVTPVCEDAAVFAAQHNILYDLVIVDIFLGRHVPAFVTATEFLKHCRRLMKGGGHFVLNYMVADEAKWEVALNNIKAFFPNVSVSAIGINRIVIATV
jgi:spermidine synthase